MKRRRAPPGAGTAARRGPQSAGKPRAGGPSAAQAQTEGSRTAAPRLCRRALYTHTLTVSSKRSQKVQLSVTPRPPQTIPPREPLGTGRAAEPTRPPHSGGLKLPRVTTRCHPKCQLHNAHRNSDYLPLEAAAWMRNIIMMCREWRQQREFL